MNPTFSFKAKIWLWNNADSAWHFITLPTDLSEQIKGFYEGPKKGFGSIRVEVKIGESTWKTSIFPDKKRGYILPIKSSIRKLEKIGAGSEVSVILKII